MLNIHKNSQLKLRSHVVKNTSNGVNFQKRRKFTKKKIKSYFESLNTKKITNRTFWKTVVPLFTNKASRGEKIILTEAEKHISDDKKICNIFNNFFSKVFSDLKIPDYYKYFSQENTCSLSTIIETFEKHPSILNIKKRKLVSVFSFRKTTRKEVLKVIQDLNAVTDE